MAEIAETYKNIPKFNQRVAQHGKRPLRSVVSGKHLQDGCHTKTLTGAYAGHWIAWNPGELLTDAHVSLVTGYLDDKKPKSKPTPKKVIVEDKE